MGNRIRMVVMSLGVLAATSLSAAGGSVTNGATTLSYGSLHWGSQPVAAFVGTEPSPAASVVYRFGYWYRIEGDDREHPMPPPDTETYVDGRVHATWADVDGKGFSASENTYVIDHEGPSGEIWSSLWMTNHNASPLNVALFHYVDADVNGTYTDDSAQLVGPGFLKFTDGSGSVMRYRARNPSHFSVKAAPLLQAELSDAAIGDLDDAGAPLGSADVTAAFEIAYPVFPEGTAVLEISISSRLPADYVRGGYSSLISYPALQTEDATTGYDVVWSWRRTEALTETSSYGAAPGFRLLARDDLDGDATENVLTRHPGTGELHVDNLALTGAASPAPNWVLASTGDFNADGRADILWRNQTSGQLSVWFMNGNARTGAVLPVPDHAVDANWAVAGTADFNNDGARDILWYNQTSGNIVLWYMNAAVQRITGAFTNPTSVGSNNWRVVGVGDFGRGPGGVLNAPDIVWQNDTSSRIVVWFMDFTGTRTSGTFTSPDSLGATSIVTGPR